MAPVMIASPAMLQASDAVEAHCNTMLEVGHGVRERTHRNLGNGDDEFRLLAGRNARSAKRDGDVVRRRVPLGGVVCG